MSLTDEEREALLNIQSLRRYPSVADEVFADVERIVAERVRQAYATALREAADTIEDACSSQRGACFCGSAPWLRARADQYDRGSE